jgi:hypothetical protein
MNGTLNPAACTTFQGARNRASPGDAMKTSSLSALLVLLAFSTLSERALAAADAPVHDASECPAIFGPGSTADAVRARRTDAVEGIVEDRYGIVLFHHVGRWSAPKVTNLAGVTLVDVDRDAHTLTFDVSATIDGCPKGTYRVDDAIALGSDGVVIATLADGVLVEKQRALHFMPVEGRAAPRFRVVWRSPYSIVRDAPTGGAAVAAGGKRPVPSASIPSAPSAKAEKLKAASTRRDKARSKKK